MPNVNMKVIPEVLVRRQHAYRRVGSFTSKSEAIRYKNQTLHSLMLVRDNPKQMGVGVRYHIYRRIT